MEMDFSSLVAQSLRETRFRHGVQLRTPRLVRRRFVLPLFFRIQFSGKKVLLRSVLQLAGHGGKSLPQVIAHDWVLHSRFAAQLLVFLLRLTKCTAYKKPA